MNIKQKLKLIIKEITPPILFKKYRKYQQKYGFFGNYNSWEDALKNSNGYDSDIILEKVKTASLKVKKGEAVYERDSVCFDEIQYSFPVLAGLLKIAVENDGKLSVLDFGGSLGSSYYPFKKFATGIKELKWNIVEQKKFVDCGKELFETEELKFYDNIENCLSNEKPHVILLSGVIQCLEYPEELITKIIDLKFSYVIFDISAFFKEPIPDRLVVQKVPPTIYNSSYPVWIFNLDKFLAYFQNQYVLISSFDSLYSQDLEILNANLKGFIFQKT
jgi:putative methyltransferase (TIGR04325 family)